MKDVIIIRKDNPDNHKAREILANNIVYFRLKHGWSQEDFADELGTTPTYVSNLENAKKNTGIDYIGYMAYILDVPLNELLVERELVRKRRVPRRKE